MSLDFTFLTSLLVQMSVARFAKRISLWFKMEFLANLRPDQNRVELPVIVGFDPSNETTNALSGRLTL